MKLDKNIHKNSYILIRELVKALRFFQEDSVFCEDLTFSQFTILDYIKEKDGIGLTELREKLVVEKSTLTRLIEPLIKKGLVYKEKSKEDSRVINVFITSEGQKIHQSIWDCFGQSITRLIENIPEGERDKVYESMTLFVRSLFKCCEKDSCCI